MEAYRTTGGLGRDRYTCYNMEPLARHERWMFREPSFLLSHRAPNKEAARCNFDTRTTYTNQVTETHRYAPPDATVAYPASQQCVTAVASLLDRLRCWRRSGHEYIFFAGQRGSLFKIWAGDTGARAQLIFWRSQVSEMSIPEDLTPLLVQFAVFNHGTPYSTPT